MSSVGSGRRRWEEEGGEGGGGGGEEEEYRGKGRNQGRRECLGGAV